MLIFCFLFSCFGQKSIIPKIFSSKRNGRESLLHDDVFKSDSDGFDPGLSLNFRAYLLYIYMLPF